MHKNRYIHRWSIHKFSKSNTSTSKNPYELALVRIGGQTNVNLQDEINTEDKIDMNADDKKSE